MADVHVLRTIVGLCDSENTLASLACCSALLRRLVAEELIERGRCPESHRLLGIPAAPEAAGRAAALLRGGFRRQFLADLAFAQQAGICYDGRQQTADFSSLPDRGRLLLHADLLAFTLDHALLYDKRLQPLAALSFVDLPACAATAQLDLRRWRAALASLTELLIRCRLNHGVVCLEPALLLGAADCTLGSVRDPCEREQLAQLAACVPWRERAALEAQLAALRFHSILARALERKRCTVFGGPAVGAPLLQAAESLSYMSAADLNLRYLDVTGVTSLSDAQMAQTLERCPQLRVLRAAGSNAGPAVLAALAGQAQEQEAPAGRHEQRLAAGSSKRGCAASLPANGPAAVGKEASSACPCLEVLDLSGCSGVKGSAVRRALRCLPELRDLRLSGCGKLHGLLDPLLPASSEAGSRAVHSGRHKSSHAAGSSGKAAALAGALGRLECLELLDADDLSGSHVLALLQHCTSLQRLALGSRNLAAERFDRQPMQLAAAHSRSNGCSSEAEASDSAGSGGIEESCSLPQLLHLQVGWGTGGRVLEQLAASSPHLVSLTCHVGAAVSDWTLGRLAGSCPQLQALRLRGSDVSGEGMAVVLEQCRQLTSLHLLGCVGPFGDNLAGDWTRPPAFRLQELRIGWGCHSLSDAGLARLLRADRAALRCLELRGAGALSDSAFATISHLDQLECLHLESCGAQAALDKGRVASTAAAPMSADAAVRALAGCQKLRALTLRSCFSMPTSAAELAGRLREACPALQTLDLA